MWNVASPFQIPLIKQHGSQHSINWEYSCKVEDVLKGSNAFHHSIVAVEEFNVAETILQNQEKLREFSGKRMQSSIEINSSDVYDVSILDKLLDDVMNNNQVIRPKLTFSSTEELPVIDDLKVGFISSSSNGPQLVHLETKSLSIVGNIDDILLEDKTDEKMFASMLGDLAFNYNNCGAFDTPKQPFVTEAEEIKPSLNVNLESPIVLIPEPAKVLEISNVDSTEALPAEINGLMDLVTRELSIMPGKSFVDSASNTIVAGEGSSYAVPSKLSLLEFESLR